MFLMLLVPIAIAKFGVKWTMALGIVALAVRFGAFTAGEITGQDIYIYIAILVHGLIFGFFFVGFCTEFADFIHSLPEALNLLLMSFLFPFDELARPRDRLFISFLSGRLEDLLKSFGALEVLGLFMGHLLFNGLYLLLMPFAFCDGFFGLCLFGFGLLPGL